MTGPETTMFGVNGWVPNNPTLPVLVYRGVVPVGAPEPIELTLAGNGWPPDWRDGVLDFHHYHSTAHEALACVTGSAHLMLGGEGGREIVVEASDLLVLPAGTGHRRIDASADFLLVGAHPDGQAWDVCREPVDAETLARIAAVPVPGIDAVGGEGGSPTRLWEDRRST